MTLRASQDHLFGALALLGYLLLSGLTELVSSLLLLWALIVVIALGAGVLRKTR